MSNIYIYLYLVHFTNQWNKPVCKKKLVLEFLATIFIMHTNTMLASWAVLVLMITCAGRVAEARAFFVFGDSLVDSGNNDYLITTARADSYPYGIDYPTRRPTGRFSNGLNIPDLISMVLILKLSLFFIIFL